jgi:GAF domain-containing protein/DNA-binding NarL/FixJ family response regulator
MRNINKNTLIATKTDYQRLSKFYEALADLSQLSVGNISVESLFSIVVSRLGQLVPDQCVSIMMVENDQRLVLSAGVGWDQSQLGSVLAYWNTESDAEYPETLRRPMVDISSSVSPLIHGLAPAEVSGITGAESVPIGSPSRPIGVLGIYVKDVRLFSSHDLTFMKSVASILAAKIEQKNTSMQVEKVTEDRGYISEITRIVGASLDMQEIYPLIANQAKKMLEFDRITVNVIDHVNQSFKFTYVAGADSSDWPAQGVHPIKGKAIDAVLQSGQGIIVQQENKHEVLNQYPDAISDQGDFHSLLCVPVYWKGEIIADLALRSKVVNAYREKDIEVADLIASQIAAAIANDTLHTAEKLYAVEQSALAEISRIIVSSVRLDDIYPRFAESAKRLLNFDRIVINTVDEQKAICFLRYTWGKNSDDFVSRKSGRPLAGTGTAAVIRSRMGLIITPEMIVGQSERFDGLRVGLDAGLQSTIAVPLIHQGRAFGAFMVRSTETDAYSLRDIHIAEQIALQISGVVWSSQVNDRLEQSAKEFAMLADLANAAGNARVLTTFLQNVNSALSQCFDYDHIAICIEQSEYSMVRYEYVDGIHVSGIDEGVVIPISSIIKLSEYSSARYGNILDQPSDSLEGPARIQAGLNSYIQFPLYSRDRPVGIIYLAGLTANAYSTDHVDLMDKISIHIAYAIDNIRFHNRVSQETSSRIALDDLITRISRSTNRREMLTIFLDSLQNAIPFDHVSFSPVSPKYYSLGTEFDEIVNSFVNRKQIPVSLVEELTRLTLEQGASVSWDENHPDSVITPELYEQLIRCGQESCLSVPMISAGSQIGALIFYSIVPNAFSSHHSRTAAVAGTVFLSAIERNEYAASTSDGLAIFLPDVGMARIGIVDSTAHCQRTLSATISDMGFDVFTETFTLESFFEEFDQINYEGSTILIWELHDPGEADLTLIRQLLGRRQNPKIVLVDHGCGSELLGEAMRAGVVGYLERDSLSSSFKTAILNVIDTGVSIEQTVVDSYFKGNSTSSFRWGEEYHSIIEQLNDRDLTILQAVANGQSNAEIATELSFAVGTIKNRLASIYKILGVADRAGAMAFAIRTGLVT